MILFNYKFVRNCFVLLGLGLGSGLSFTQSALALGELGISSQNSTLLNAAHETQLVHVTSDAQEGTIDIKLLLDNNYDVLGMLYTDDTGDRAEFAVAELPLGFVLVEKSGYDVAKLGSPNFDSKVGGTIVLDYLVNALWSSRDSLSVEAVRIGNEWHLETRDQSGSHPFNHIFLEGNFWFGKVVGISQVLVDII